MIPKKSPKSKKAGTSIYNLALGRLLVRRRKQMKMKQHVAAAKIGVSRTTYWSYENGGYEPLLTVLINITKVFNISIEEIYNESKVLSNHDF